MFLILGLNSLAQQVSLTGKVINPDENPVKKVLVYLANNPSLYCYSDTLGNFSLTNISTSVSEAMQDKIISFESRKLSVYAYNQSIAVDVFTIDGRLVKNIVNLRYCLGTFGLYPEAYLSELPKAIYLVRVIVGNTSQSFKIQNLIPTAFPQGITEYDINNIIDTSITESKSEPDKETKSEALDTLILVHDFYKSRKIPLNSYTIQYDTIHLNNFADYSIAEGFESAVTHWHNGYGNFTDIFSADSVQFIVHYDTLSILKGDLKIITIPVDKIEGLENSIKFISGLHFEPSGTKLFQPAQVSVLMKDSIPKNLVVFHFNDKGETYYIPYVSHKLIGYGYCIIFNINHFSSVGIGIGDIHPPTDNPEEFKISDQFLSYIDEYMRYSESIGKFSPPPIELFTVWYNNVVVPMINSIITWEDFGAALDEFLIIAEICARIGMGGWSDLPFWDSARELFSDKMMKIWNACIAEYNGLGNKCLKRAILDIALQVLKLNAVVGGTFCPDLTDFSSALNAFGNGEALNLVNKIEFSTPIKDLEPDSSYLVQYILESISGNPLPEVISWSSSDPSVATINDEGLIIALKKGITVIKAKICDVENTFKLEVGYNCEEYYCRNEDDSCFSGIYSCTGVISRIDTPFQTVVRCGNRWTIRWEYYFAMEGELGQNLSSFKSISFYSQLNRPIALSNECESIYEVYFNYNNKNSAFICEGRNFHFSRSGWYTNEGYLIGDLLIFDVRYNSGNNYYKTTKFFCNRIDK